MQELENLELYNDDCFNVFPKIKNDTVNLFVLDLPYNQTACKWDKDIIPLDKMWDSIKRIMKPNGIVIMFCTAKFGYRLIHSNPKWFRYDLIWKKSRKVGFLSANKMPLRQHENIYLFKPEQGTYHPQKTEGHKPRDRTHNKKRNDKIVYGELKNGNNTDETRHPTSIIDHENIYLFKPKQGTYHPQKTEGKPYKCKQGQQTNLYGIEDKDKVFTENKGDRHPTSLIDYDGDSILIHKNPHKTIHRTQKPVELCEWLIKTYSNEKDTVMDFTMGSGTVARACLNTNRKFIGVEKDKEIYEKAQDRIAEHITK